ncbi:hypothetical protein AAZX31_18G114000 [Glycine max]
MKVKRKQSGVVNHNACLSDRFHRGISSQDSLNWRRRCLCDFFSLLHEWILLGLIYSICSWIFTLSMDCNS